MSTTMATTATTTGIYDYEDDDGDLYGDDDYQETSGRPGCADSGVAAIQSPKGGKSMNDVVLGYALMLVRDKLQQSKH